MKLLHTSDLHAGKKLYDNISRKEDLIYALEQIEKVCKEESVELLLIAGDIFDKRNPDFESQEIILDFLTRVNALGLHTLLIAGNHDSYDFMKIYKNLKKLANIHVYDRPSKDLSEMVFRYEDMAVACLPYPDERVITHFQEEKERSYAHKVAQYMKALSQAVEDSRYRLLMAHMMVDRAEVSGSEILWSVSPYYAVKAESIPDNFNYVALGHVHKSQRIEGVVPKVYYSGSPYQIDFSEKLADKFVNLIILEDGLVRVEPIRLDLKRQLIEVWLGENDPVEDKLKNFLSERVLLKVRMQVRLGDPQLNARKDLVQRILGDRLARLELEPLQDKKYSESTGEGLNLEELYRQYYADRYGSEPVQELVSIFVELLNKASHEAH